MSKHMTENEFYALAYEPMTQERYERLCAEYGIEPEVRLARYVDPTYTWNEANTMVAKRIHQLRAGAKRREAQSNPATVAAVRTATLAAMAREQQALVEEAEIDRGN